MALTSPVASLRSRRKSIAEINVVPYIDVMLVLLVVFMVTAPLMTQGIVLQLPKVSAEPIPIKEEPVVVSVNRAGGYHLNVGKQPKQELELSTILSTIEVIILEVPSTLLMVEADTEVPYGKVMQLISGLKRIGAANVGFVTDPAGVDPDQGA